MKTLTVEKAQELIAFLSDKAKDGNITLAQENYLQALEMALLVLESKRDAEIYGNGFVACFAGGEVRKADPQKVRISFTDSGLGYDLSPQKSPEIPDRSMLRQLVDVVWSEAKESTEVPSTKWADQLIGKVFPGTDKKTEVL